MKVAVLADIHGNYVALKAVLEDCKHNGVNEYIVAGDIIDGCPQPRETLSLIREISKWVIKGNREDYIMKYHEGYLPEWDNCLQYSAIRWTYSQLDTSMLEYIDGLPEQLVVDINGTTPIHVVHGSPFGISKKINPHDEVKLKEMFSHINQRAIVCGHSHISWIKEVDGFTVVNAGSVGLAIRSIPGYAEYALFDWDGKHWRPEKRSVPYDIGEVHNSYISSGFLKEGGAFARAALSGIETGKNVPYDFVTYAYKLAEEAGYINCKVVPDDIWKRAEKTWDWTA